MEIKFKIEVDFSKKHDDEPEKEKSPVSQAIWFRILMPLLITVVSFIVIIFMIAVVYGNDGSADKNGNKKKDNPTFQQNFNF